MTNLDIWGQGYDDGVRGEECSFWRSLHFHPTCDDDLEAYVAGHRAGALDRWYEGEA